MTLVGNADGRLHVCRQVEDYALRGIEFEAMGFLSFTVETTYERRMKTENENETNYDDDHSHDLNHGPRNQYGQYLTNHPKSSTHTRVF